MLLTTDSSISFQSGRRTLVSNRIKSSKVEQNIEIEFRRTLRLIRGRRGSEIAKGSARSTQTVPQP